jgi:hypothetical protein
MDVFVRSERAGGRLNADCGSHGLVSREFDRRIASHFYTVCYGLVLQLALTHWETRAKVKSLGYH